MSIEIKIPPLPESVTDAVIASWHKQPGDTVKRGENMVDIETDKIVLEVPASTDGVLLEIIEQDGSTVLASQVIGKIDEQAVAATSQPESTKQSSTATASPSVRKLMHAHDLDAQHIQGSGKHGKILQQDAQKAIASSTPSSESREQKRVPMTRMRARIAERLVTAQHESAMLTTFNEVDMQPIMELRARYRKTFEEKHGVRLGFMSFFVNSAVAALKKFPVINASIENNDLIYHGFYDIGIAISSGRGLVVPVLRNADLMLMHEIEAHIRDFSQRAQSSELGIDELNGGTFTITNGGIYGSMLSTPIINPPQSAILGMHKIQERPMAKEGAVVIQPIMYLALSYDHRIIDGADAVQFLVAIKQALEDPARLLLNM